jgi:Ca2+-binding RTX toxin-like protein
LLLNAGDQITFDWDFMGHDYLPYNDFAFVAINGVATLLSDIAKVGNYGTTGWKTFTYTAPITGTLKIGMGQFNAGDSNLNSHLLVDNVRINGASTHSFEKGSFAGDAPPSITGDLAVIAIKGRGVQLTTADVLAVDPDSAPAQLTFTVTGTSHGHIAASPNGPAIGSFTQAQLNSGGVFFVADSNPDGTLYAGQGSFTVSLSDGVQWTPTATTTVGVYIVDAQFTVLTADGLNFEGSHQIETMGSGTIVPDAQHPQTAFVVVNEAADRDFIFTGSGFRYDLVTGALTAGTITSILEQTHNPHIPGNTVLPIAKFDLNVPAADWMKAVIATANGDQSLIEALTKPWTFNFIGGGGPDAFNSGDQNDVFTGGAGNDAFDGQFGYDRAYYGNATGPINVQLAAGTVTGDASVGADTLRSIELVTGSNSADTFNATGFSATSTNAGSTVTSNTAGMFNEFEGRGGDDIITGNGVTRISYLHATSGVTVTFANGNATNSWTSTTSGASGTATGDASTGTDHFTGVNSVRGSNFDDVLHGSNNPFGTAEDFEGMGGNDQIDGGGGFDRAVYNFVHDGAGITVNLAAGTGTGGPDTGTDTLISIEGIWGTEFADIYNAVGFTTTSTNAGNSPISPTNSGASDFNEFEGGGGNDTITGNGNTRIAYYHATGGVVVTLGTNTDPNVTTNHGSAVGASTGIDDIVSGVNAVTGSEFNDILTGNAFNSTLDGRGGNDVLDGGGGNDRLTGGTGSDIFVYKPGYGVTTVTDFSHASADRIDLRAFSGIHSIDNLTFSPSGTTLTITSAAGGFTNTTHNIVIQGYDPVSNPVTAADFIFNVATGPSVSVTVQTPDGYDFSTLYGDMAASSLATSAITTDHIFAVDVAKGITFEMIGTGFIYDSVAHHFTSGTITEIDILNTTDPTQATQDHVLVNTNGWNIDVVNFFSAIGAYAANNTNTALLNGIFNGATYSIVGSAGFADNNSQPHDGADVFFGGDHPDVFNGMPGPFGPSDRGNDTVDYSHAPAVSGSTGIIVDLSNPASNTGAAQGDTYISIENLRGTNFDDILTGDANNNVLEGGLGNDTLNGGVGDTVSYEHATDYVTVDLSNHAQQDTHSAGLDTLSNFEILLGSSHDDILTGDGNSTLEGGPGDDHLIGQLNGHDTASYQHATSGVTVSLNVSIAQPTGGAGTDTLTNIANLFGSQFSDNLTGNTHNNTLFGNGGNDTFVFNANALGGIGQDTIGDFMSGQDHIKLDYAAFDPSSASSFNAWFGSHVSIVGGDILIDLHVNNLTGHDTILLKNASFGGLHANDFILPAA